MISKCNNPKNPEYQLYKAKGIKVCERWNNSFDSFQKDMGDMPVGSTLSRIDKTKGFEKSNCYWKAIVKSIPYKKNYKLMRTKSHCMGVYKCRRSKLFISEITFCNEKIEIGKFEKRKDAIKARIKAEIEFLGYLEQNQFSYLLK